jgi:hypothetical protein
MENSLSIVACRFQRKKKAQWEKGIIIGRNGNGQTIIDELAKPVKTIWNYQLEHVRLSVDIEV